MHEVEIQSLATIDVPDWWALTPADLERIAADLLGPLPGGWVRQGGNFIRIGKVKKFGSDARKLSEELSALSAEAKRVLSEGGDESLLRAAAFYHLRFENVHPLCEANGRIGRVILAAQLQQSLKIPAADTLSGLKDWEADYKRLFGLFATNSLPLMFELLLDLLSRITGVMPSPHGAEGRSRGRSRGGQVANLSLDARSRGGHGAEGVNGAEGVRLLIYHLTGTEPRNLKKI